MKKEINSIKNEIMMINQNILRLNIYKDVCRINKDIEDGGYFSNNVERHLIYEIKNFANNYDDFNNIVWAITKSVDEDNLADVISNLTLHYETAKRDALERLFLLS